MNVFVPPKRKLIELLLMFIFAGGLYFFYPEIEVVMLFIFGFVWNWAASNELAFLVENRRHRMSMLGIVVKLQNLFLKPVSWAPHFVQRLVAILPAGLFWMMVTYMNDSDMPWWAPFVGSMTFELLQLELNFISRHKGSP